MEQLETEWTEYPVLHFDMSIAKQGTIENLKKQSELYALLRKE